MQDIIPYHQIVDLGFKRFEMPDTVFYGMYGYQCFTMTLKLSKKVTASWCCESRLVELWHIDKQDNIHARLPVEDIETLKRWITFFKKPKKTKLKAIEAINPKI